ncbi:hypothetical protein GJ496_011551 [Pomphorhynchus laevis]|nr:hypothetical protein GJ496_011551 [Pomphorhynchus laevis]
MIYIAESTFDPVQRYTSNSIYRRIRHGIPWCAKGSTTPALRQFLTFVFNEVLFTSLFEFASVLLLTTHSCLLVCRGLSCRKEYKFRMPVVIA